MKDDRVDERSFIKLILRLVQADVDSITVLGSTGSYMYLNREERGRVARLAVQHAGEIPVLVGVGALRTSQVLEHIDDAQAVGATALLLAPVSYQKLNDNEVFELFQTVTHHTDLPVVLYDNPATTHFSFSIELYERIARLPGIVSIKIPGVLSDPKSAKAHVDAIRKVIPNHVSIGVSGDVSGAAGLIAGCDLWYSVLGGTLPDPVLDIVRAAQCEKSGNPVDLSNHLDPVWDLFAEYGGSLRVTAAIAEHLGLVNPHSLPLPVQGLSVEQRKRVIQVVDDLSLR